ncbi:DUTP diphosphatase [Sulfurovum sp. enrichment culture clone C5]|uniref:dUTP diphosphatase n=1 Tax=Sulfurovum sp. enrichment culture clone C5 TaxID=497650 RepID=A0A0S4XNG9_9BACT|nr:DUTP diphosphatase [Sulfurovum sp. enrichment culture clone C5]
MSKIKSMLMLQQELNDNTNGQGWEKGITKQGKPIDWKRCILLESAELIESYPWKHWKNIDAPADKENIKIEVVDIWHFVMSEILKINATTSNKTIENLIEEINSLSNFSMLQNPSNEIADDHFEQIANIENFIKILLNSQDWQEMTDSYFFIVSQSGLNLDSLYQLYIGKNILNKFRQDNGYKDGSYKKIWDGKEDNVIMQEILMNDSSITPQRLYEQLSEIYHS